mmetsp:Transcript_633/g.1502  ORF Transcript_633/g.1502 Transcript_633/m.1502 type:complete len:200 (-) Transcript_633:338-937(-)
MFCASLCDRRSDGGTTVSARPMGTCPEPEQALIQEVPLLFQGVIKAGHLEVILGLVLFAPLCLVHRLPDDLLHVVITILVQILHHVHDAVLGIRFLGGACGRLPSSLRAQVHPAVVTVLAFHLRQGHDNVVFLDLDAGVCWVDVLLKIRLDHPVILAVEIHHFEVEGRLGEVTSDLLRGQRLYALHSHVHSDMRLVVAS